MRPTTKSELQKLINDESVVTSDIDVSLMTDMSYLFKDKVLFNECINKCDTRGVTNMGACLLERVRSMENAFLSHRTP